MRGGPILQNIFTDRTDSLNKKVRNHSPCQRMSSFYVFLLALRPNAGHGLLIHEVSRSHTTTHHSREDSSWWVISSSQRPLPDNTQHSQQTNIHAPGGIQTHNLSRRATVDLRFRPRGHWERHERYLTHTNTFLWYCDTFRRHLPHLLGALHLILKLGSTYTCIICMRKELVFNNKKLTLLREFTNS